MMHFLFQITDKKTKSFWHFGTKVINIMVCSSTLLLYVEGDVNNFG